MPPNRLIIRSHFLGLSFTNWAYIPYVDVGVSPFHALGTYIEIYRTYKYRRSRLQMRNRGLESLSILSVPRLRYATQKYMGEAPYGRCIC